MASKFLDAELTMGCKSVPRSLRKPHIVNKIVIVYPLAFPLTSTFARVNGDLEALIEASWEKETLQDVLGGDDNDGNGSDDKEGVPRIGRRKSNIGLVSMIRSEMLMQPSKEM